MATVPAPVTGSFTAAGQASAAFAPMPGVPFDFDLNGVFAATVALQRSFDGGTTWNTVALPSSGAPLSTTSSVSSSYVENEGGVVYRFQCTAWTSGTVTYRLSQ